MVGITTFPPFASATLFALPSLTPMQFRGAWDPTFTYVKNDGVFFNGSSYICIANNIAQEPDTSPPFWSIMAEASTLDSISTNPGDILFRGNSVWQSLPASITGDVLQTNGVGSAPSWVTLTALIDSICSTRGAVLFRGSTVWSGLNPGTTGQTLQTNGAGADPTWVTPATGDTSAATNPPAGTIGETLTNAAAAVSVVSATPKTIVTLSITAGHWLVWGYGVTNPAGTTTTSFISFSASSTTNVIGTAPAIFQDTSAWAAGLGLTANFGPKRFDFTTTTNVFAVADIGFGVSTMTCDMGLWALRIF